MFTRCTCDQIMVICMKFAGRYSLSDAKCDRRARAESFIRCWCRFWVIFWWSEPMRCALIRRCQKIFGWNKLVSFSPLSKHIVICCQQQTHEAHECSIHFFSLFLILAHGGLHNFVVVAHAAMVFILISNELKVGAFLVHLQKRKMFGIFAKGFGPKRTLYISAGMRNKHEIRSKYVFCINCSNHVHFEFQ